MGQRGIVRLGADGVEFPEDFLAKEIQRPARGSGGTAQGAELVKMGGETGNFLGNVALVRKQGHFPDDAFIVRGNGQVGISQALEHSLPKPDRHGRGMFRNTEAELL